ncbi:MAG: hypothetical protein IJQ79_06055 [Bacteroidales bacterium]|nr:hypothetical protein [Bacteroidales bacterium]
MKKTIITTVLAAIAFTFVACDKELSSEIVQGQENQEDNPEGQAPDNGALPGGEYNIVFSAVREGLGNGPESKSTIASGGVVSWESGDAISILWNGGRTTSVTTDSGANASFSAQVDAEAAGGTYFAVYPSSIIAELSSADVLSVTVPSVQDGTFSGANINVAKTTATTFEFKAIGNVIKFTVTDADVTKMRIISWDKTPLAGTCSVNVSGTAPAISDYDATSSEIEVAVSGAGTYYAVVLPGVHAEGLLFAPETADSYKRSAYADKSWTAERKHITDFGGVQSHCRNLFVSASGSGKGLDASSPMSPADFKALLSQATDDAETAARNFHLLFGCTITVQDDIAIDEIQVEFGSSFKHACQFTITGASASTAISAAGTNRLFRFSNNTDVTLSGITLTGGSATGNGGAIEIDNGSTGPATVACNNVTFGSNTASTNGGAVSLTGRGKPASFIANGCTFTGNSAGSRGGVFYQSAGNDSQAENSTSSFVDCTFSGNTATTNGGVAQIYRGTANYIGNNAFTGNTSATGGVFHVNGVGELNVTGGTFGTDNDTSFASANKATGDGDGGAVLYYEAGTVRFDGSLFQYNQSSKNAGVATSKGKGSCVFTNCQFSHNKATANGGAVYVTNNGVLTLDHCNGNVNSAVSGGVAQVYKGSLTVIEGTYNANKATGAGGVFYLNSSTASLNAEGVSFLDNSSRDTSTSAKDDRESGGAVCASNASSAILNNCYFYNNRAGAAAYSDSKEYGGAICVNKSSVIASNCNFYGNKGNRGSAVFLTNGNGGLFKAERCSFHGNKQYSRGVIYSPGSNVIMVNQCSFFDQTLRTTENDGWGLWIQGEGASCVVCANNSSFYATSNASSRVSGINSNGPQLISNITVIGPFPTDHGAVRTGVAAKTVYVNNVFINTNTANPSIQCKEAAQNITSYNVLGAKCSFTPNSTNQTGVSADGFTWSPDSGANDALTLWKSWFTWSGASQGATVSSITDAYASFNVDASSYGGVLGSMSHVGNAFKSWLEESSPAAYTVNQQGTARAAAYWPGSYQN